MARESNRAKRAAEMAAADEAAHQIPVAERPAKIEELRAAREEFHRVAIAAVVAARGLSDQIRALEDLDQVNRMLAKVKARRGGGNVVMQALPATVVMRHKPKG